eukprot:2673425-Amphidinium_carterae.2
MESGHKSPHLLHGALRPSAQEVTEFGALYAAEFAIMTLPPIVNAHPALAAPQEVALLCANDGGHISIALSP